MEVLLLKSSLFKPEEFGEMFKNEQFEDIYSLSSRDFQDLISLEDFVELSRSFNEGVNYYELEFTSILKGLNHYIWLDDRKDKAISVSVDKDLQIQSLLLKPYETSVEKDNVYSKNKYSMPIEGEWVVFWGGTNEMVNYHYSYDNQRYAYDLVKTGKDNETNKDTDYLNENYFAYNKDILAPEDGKVIKVIDGVKDNVPGEMNANNPEGNYVIIEHENNEYSMLAHLKKGSIKVKTGELVNEGQHIGQCGNSGHSSEPHLHFQVMDSADLKKAKSIRIRFKDDYEPIRGDTISNKKEQKDSFEDRVEKAENALTFTDFILAIPRAIAQIFK